MTSLVQRVRNWIADESRSMELGRIDASELARIAADAGVPAGELYDLARHPGAADLLPERARAIGLDLAALTRKEPAVLRDMQRLCAQCGRHDRCRQDLSADPDDAVWQSYCPNSLTLRALQ